MHNLTWNKVTFTLTLSFNSDTSIPGQKWVCTFDQRYMLWTYNTSESRGLDFQVLVLHHVLFHYKDFVTVFDNIPAILEQSFKFDFNVNYLAI